jgi:hypothetical protein
MHLGLPDDVSWWALVALLPISAVLLGTPQLAMLAYVRAAGSKALRFVYLAASAGMLGYYHYRLSNADLSASSTAAVGLYFLAFSLAVASAAAGGILLWAHRWLIRNRKTH